MTRNILLAAILVILAGGAWYYWKKEQSEQRQKQVERMLEEIDQESEIRKLQIEREASMRGRISDYAQMQRYYQGGDAGSTAHDMAMKLDYRGLVAMEDSMRALVDSLANVRRQELLGR